ncbi:adhesin [Burkholderia sp. Ac-20353]|uniref:adhesin n=1 Tax=Burkholderia sp. Ac-20353 TaxID=2703894 RepID=UPI00197C6560|nr:adhesin [Burkholderia sp. Ac-20353]MBN3786732.1 adhesin [Burkholderia sp. Ac-20353]
MRRAVHIAVIALLAYLVADRALLHAQGRDASPQACAQGAERVKYDALGRGFDDAAASSQSEAFMSGCLVTGRGGNDATIANN